MRTICILVDPCLTEVDRWDLYDTAIAQMFRREGSVRCSSCATSHTGKYVFEMVLIVTCWLDGCQASREAALSYYVLNYISSNWSCLRLGAAFLDKMVDSARYSESSLHRLSEKFLKRWALRLQLLTFQKVFFEAGPRSIHPSLNDRSTNQPADGHRTSPPPPPPPPNYTVIYFLSSVFTPLQSSED